MPEQTSQNSSSHDIPKEIRSKLLLSENSTVPNFQYGILPARRKRIRLLRLLPGVLHNPSVDCEMFEAEFNERRQLVKIKEDTSQDRSEFGKKNEQPQLIKIEKDTSQDQSRLRRRDEPIEYEALSWRWGDEANSPYVIMIKKNGSLFKKRVSETLGLALKYLRLERERILWIDAVCINQEDKEERSYQVSMMSLVYTGATRVCVWLGDDDEHSTVAIHFIRDEIAKLKDFDRLCTDKQHASKWRALLMLMQRPWFSRRWVVQEIALAKEAEVYCGPEKIAWRDLAIAVELFVEVETATHRLSELMKKDEKFTVIPNWFEHISELGASLLVNATARIFREHQRDDIVRMYRGRQESSRRSLLSLEYLVTSLSIFGCGRPHDSVYALIAIARDAAPHPPTSVTQKGTEDDSEELISRFFAKELEEKPYPLDYTSPYPDVCKEFTRFCIDNSAKTDPLKALDILCRPWAKDWRPGEEDPPGEELKSEPEKSVFLLHEGSWKIRKRLPTNRTTEPQDRGGNLLGSRNSVNDEFAVLHELSQTSGYIGPAPERQVIQWSQDDESQTESGSHASEGSGNARFSSTEFTGSERISSELSRQNSEDYVYSEETFEDARSTRVYYEEMQKMPQYGLFPVSKKYGSSNGDTQSLRTSCDTKDPSTITHADYISLKWEKWLRPPSQDGLAPPKPEKPPCMCPKRKRRRNEKRKEQEESRVAGIRDLGLPSWIATIAGAPFDIFPHPGMDMVKMGRKNADPLVGIPQDGHRNYCAAQTIAVDLKTLKFRKRVRLGHYSLYVKGFWFDKIAEVAQVSQAGAIPASWLDMGGWSNARRPRRGQEDINDPPDEFWRTLVADRGRHDRNPPYYYARACKETIMKGGLRSNAVDTTALIYNERNSIIAEFCRRVQAVIWNRALIRTEKGALGLVNEHVRVGDLVCVIYGCTVPVVLRKGHVKSQKERDDEQFEDRFEAMRNAMRKCERFRARKAWYKENCEKNDYKGKLDPKDKAKMNELNAESDRMRREQKQKEGAQKQQQAEKSEENPEKQKQAQKSREDTDEPEEENFEGRMDIESEDETEVSDCESECCKSETEAEKISDRKDDSGTSEANGDSKDIHEKGRYRQKKARRRDPFRHYKFLGEAYIHGQMDGEAVREKFYKVKPDHIFELR